MANTGNIENVVVDVIETPLSLKLIKKDIHKKHVIVFPNGELYLGNKEVIGYSDNVSMFYPALKEKPDMIPALYVIRFVQKKGDMMAEFVTGFDLLEDGRIWCGSLRSRWTGDGVPRKEAKECIFGDMDSAIIHINDTLGVDEWNFFMEDAF